MNVFAPCLAGVLAALPCTSQEHWTVFEKWVHLIAQKHASAERDVQRASRLLRAHDPKAARAALEAARQAVEGARIGMQKLRTTWTEQSGDLDQIALVRVRIVRDLALNNKGGPEPKNPFVRALSRIVCGFLDSVNRTLEADVLQTCFVGTNRYGGPQHGRPPKLVPGQRIGLTNHPHSTGLLLDKKDVGRTFWVMLSPPYLSSGVPQFRRYIVLVMPTGPSRRL